MFTEDMTSLIKFAMTKKISGLETKTGYNGAPILRVSADSIENIKSIKEWCDNLGFSNKIIDNNDFDTPMGLRKTDGAWDLFCVFGEDIEDDFFKLKGEI